MMRRQHGFTLVEMLVALSVASLLISLVYGAVLTGQRSAQAVDQRIVTSEVMRIGWQFLDDAISRARAIRNPRDRTDRTSFHGEPDSLAFVADLPAYVGTGGLVEIGLLVREQAGARQLVLTRRRYQPEDDAQSGERQALEQAVLVERLGEIEINYLGAADDDEAIAWVGQWQERNVLPSLVSISVRPSDQPAWPLLISRPIAGTESIEDELPPDMESTPDSAQPDLESEAERDPA